MEELAGRLRALDPDAEAAVRVIAYYDRLVEGRAGLETLVRGAAVLSGSPARLVDAPRRVRIRVEPDGRRRDEDGPVSADWPSLPLPRGSGPAVWLERERSGTVLEAVILERAAAAIGIVLDRSRGRAPAAPDPDDPALVETVTDPSAPEAVRLYAARRLGLDPAGTVRALALPGSRLHLQQHPFPELPAGRIGVGPDGPVERLPLSAAAARTALRFTSEDTPQDPGPRVVHADELGALALLADRAYPDDAPPTDLNALDRAAASVPLLLPTLAAWACAHGLRDAAGKLRVHHSTLRDRLDRAQSLLGWPLTTPQGRLRLQLALALHRLRRVD
ncbi:helix-turn-helix domain-containing protein [Streptomyces sp. SKN60]|uniref:helix-turn-helix domain-containing protein n=1 Tax=Streptomyces sp. SKN60 TaxID=2855506 RepID=UPI002247FBD8|nr:helix-turn-helix domain-containing protein [Streptomyces sp. SKN60]MCX2181943.1 helix-turn-helix domain-containing protein [Streptomyces sp. SKN60]